MKEKLNNILNLSKIFVKENENNLGLVKDKDKIIYKKSILFWIYVILFLGILYISSEVVRYMIKAGKPEIVLSGFLLVLDIIIIIRTIMVSPSVFYFSRDIENILHLPIKPIEILISKFIAILVMTYEVEIIFGFIPLLVYGIHMHMELSYFLNVILVLAIFPIFAVIIISVLMMFIMKTIKIFKNKDIMQVTVSFILILLIMIFMNKAILGTFKDLEYLGDNREVVLNNIDEKIIEISKYFITIDSLREILEDKNIFTTILNYVKVILINLVSFLVFIFLGKRIYLKQLLKASFYYKNNKKKKTKLKKIKKTNIGVSYIRKEFKTLFKNPLFLIQSIYPVILLMVILSILIFIFVPAFRVVLQSEEYKEIIKDLNFDIEAACIIIGAIQIVGLFNYTSITSISREGKNAYVMKYLPVRLDRQIIYKSIPQVVINTICSATILAVISFRLPEIELKYIFIMGIICFLLNIINSMILVIIDLMMPKLEWDSEYEILKKNKNKLFQYSLIIFNILFLEYVQKFFENHNLNTSMYVFVGEIVMLLVIFNIIIWKYKNKLFRNIK